MRMHDRTDTHENSDVHYKNTIFIKLLIIIVLQKDGIIFRMLQMNTEYLVGRTRYVKNGHGVHKSHQLERSVIVCKLNPTTTLF